MEENRERDRKHRELCDAVIELMGFAEAGAETYLTHAFFLQTIREHRLAGTSLEHVAMRGLSVYPVWMIQSRKSAAFLLQGATSPLDIEALMRRVREHSPHLESCAFLPLEGFVRFAAQVRRATSLQPSTFLVSASSAHPNAYGWIYPDRAFTMIRFATKPIGVTSHEEVSPHGQPAPSS